MYIIMYKYSALKINRKSFPNNIKNPIAPAPRYEKSKDTTRELDNPQEEKKIKKAVNDISTDLSSLFVDVKSISGQLPSLVVTREEVNTFKLRIEKYDKELEQAVKTIRKGVDVRVSPAVLSETHVGMLDQIKTVNN